MKAKLAQRWKGRTGALLTRQLLHSACFGAVFVWLLAGRFREAVPSLSFVVVSSLLLAGHWAVASLGDGLV